MAEETKDTAATAAAQQSAAAAKSARRQGPTFADILQAVKALGPSFSQAERDELIRAIAGSPVPAVAAEPSPYDGHARFCFQVSWSEFSSQIEATSPREAWALFCDSIKQYPSPKAGKVECLGAVKPVTPVATDEKAEATEVAAA